MSTLKFSFVFLLFTLFFSINTPGSQKPKALTPQSEQSVLAPKEKFKQKVQRFIQQHKKKKNARQYDKEKPVNKTGKKTGMNIALISLILGIVSQAAFWLSFLFVGSVFFTSTGLILMLLSIVAGTIAFFMGIKELKYHSSYQKRWMAILGIILGGLWLVIILVANFILTYL